jgi:hypothetical protein
MNKLSELAVASPVGNWVSMENYRQVSAIGVLLDADSAETLTVQLRKATDASGTNAANFGTAVTVASGATDTDLSAIQTEWSQALGSFSAGVPFTHVSATISDVASPEASFGVVLRSEPRFSV